MRALDNGYRILFDEQAVITHAHDIDNIGILNTLRGMAHGRKVFSALHPDYDLSQLPGLPHLAGIENSWYVFPALAKPYWKASRVTLWLFSMYKAKGSGRLWQYSQRFAILSGLSEASGV